jgi:murein DD-endopeptidase MepM/ murein hydrolase activator NlpD
MSKIKKICLGMLLFLVVGFLIPERIQIPVLGADKSDWNSQSFWFEPWGRSGVHKGIDIFSKPGTHVVSTIDGLVVYTGYLKMGGNVVIVLGPKWRFHYFAHLDTIHASTWSFVGSGSVIGTVGDSGNAKGKPHHLHYSIVRLFPAPWAMDSYTQGYKKAFFIDPHRYLSKRGR